MTPAEVLAAAADRLDALTKYATEGPWTDIPMLGDAEGSDVIDWAGASVVREVEDADAAYIAAVDPLVGKALTELLRRQAEQLTRLPVGTQRFVCEREHGGYGHGLALARLIIGERDGVDPNER